MTTTDRYLTHSFRTGNLTTSLRISEGGDVALMQLDSRGDIVTDVESTLPPRLALHLVDRAFELPHDLEGRNTNALSTGTGSDMPRPLLAESNSALQLIREIRMLTPDILDNASISEPVSWPGSTERPGRWRTESTGTLTLVLDVVCTIFFIGLG